MAYTDIDKPSDYFSTNLWVADDSSPRSFTGFGHQPDLVWTKHRGTSSTYHTLTDSVRGGNKALSTPTNAAEDSGSHGIISSFDSDGITVTNGTNATYPRLTFNELDPFGSGGGNYVCWSWKAGGTGVSNTNGSITSTVSANTTSGFSIVSWTGTGANGSVGHGLGTTPSCFILKDRDDAYDWRVYHQSTGNTGATILNSTTAFVTDSSYYNNTSPDSSKFYLGNNAGTNGSGRNYIAYCFAEKKGFSKFGSYLGNGTGSGGGPFIYLGFKPAFFLLKESTGADNWTLMDNRRLGYNKRNDHLFPNLPNSEYASDRIQLYSNGVKIVDDDGSINQSGQTYIYMAFAESPFTTSTGIPTTAR